LVDCLRSKQYCSKEAGTKEGLKDIYDSGENVVHTEIQP
jgi:hypothetical protein